MATIAMAQRAATAATRTRDEEREGDDADDGPPPPWRGYRRPPSGDQSRVRARSIFGQATPRCVAVEFCAATRHDGGPVRFSLLCNGDRVVAEGVAVNTTTRRFRFVLPADEVVWSLALRAEAGEVGVIIVRLVLVLAAIVAVTSSQPSAPSPTSPFLSPSASLAVRLSYSSASSPSSSSQSCSS